jgi:hypothetical protein
LRSENRVCRAVLSSLTESITTQSSVVLFSGCQSRLLEAGAACIRLGSDETVPLKRKKTSLPFVLAQMLPVSYLVSKRDGLTRTAPNKRVSSLSASVSDRLNISVQQFQPTQCIRYGDRLMIRYESKLFRSEPSNPTISSTPAAQVGTSSERLPRMEGGENR